MGQKAPDPGSATLKTTTNKRGGSTIYSLINRAIGMQNNNRLHVTQKVYLKKNRRFSGKKKDRQGG
jgi:hypothetical protein